MKVLAVDKSLNPINEVTWEAATKAIALGKAHALDLLTWEMVKDDYPRVIVFPEFLATRKADLKLLKKFYDLIGKS